MLPSCLRQIYSTHSDECLTDGSWNQKEILGDPISLVDKDSQTQKMGQYVEIYERFPTCSLVKVHEGNPLQQIMMELLTKKKDDHGRNGYANSKKSSVFM